eukprot:832968-Lingulodinium_polyedra.AAC.1
MSQGVRVVMPHCAPTKFGPSCFASAGIQYGFSSSAQILSVYAHPCHVVRRIFPSRVVVPGFLVGAAECPLNTCGVIVLAEFRVEDWFVRVALRLV